MPFFLFNGSFNTGFCSFDLDKQEDFCALEKNQTQTSPGKKSSQKKANIMVIFWTLEGHSSWWPKKSHDLGRISVNFRSNVGPDLEPPPVAHIAAGAKPCADQRGPCGALDFKLCDSWVFL